MSYDVKPLKAPRSAGGLLRVLVSMGESGVTGGALATKFLKDIGVAALRETPCHEPLPNVHPLFEGSTATVPDADAAPVPAYEPKEPTPARGFAFETQADYRVAYRNGLSPVTVAERVLQWRNDGDALTPPMRTFIAQDRDDLLTQAQASAQRWAAGKPHSAWDGVPVGIKDELDQAGYPTTVGTRFLGGQPAPHDAEVVARMRRAGALLIGKLNMHEIGMGVTGLNPHHGACRNPYNPGHLTGGSSSGPGAAVASGFGPMAVGADGGGSIRIPAALCGVVGLKGTFGRFSERGAAPLCWSVAHVGPLAATVADCAAAYTVLAGPDRDDPNTWYQPPVTVDGLDSDIKELRVGVYPGWFNHADAEVVQVCRTMVSNLEKQGALVREIEIPELALLRTAHLITISSEMLSAQWEHYCEGLDRYGLDVRLNFALVKRMRNTDYILAQRHRVRLFKHFEKVLTEVDVIVSPATGRTAPPVPADALKTGESNLALTDQIMRFAPAANLTGLPAISFPAGYSSEGLPIGFQVMGRPWSEALLLRVAAVAERFVERKAPRVYRNLINA